MTDSPPEVLPISVVIPTRNSMDKLPRHLERQAPLFARCAEIVHCDSFSTDTTKSFLSENLRHPALRQCDHPPGLYQSWNYAIGRCTQPFIYISTVGDDLDIAGLLRLYDLALQTEADFVMSPPRFIDEAGRANADLRWPIHHLIQNHRLDRPGIVPSQTVYLEAILHAPDGIMGSAASCLYRSSFLKARPFPLGFHGACDSAWALRYVPEARCALLPEAVSSFLLHPKTYESHGVLNARIRVLIRDFLRHELNKLRSSPADQLAILGFSPDLIRQLRRFNILDLLRARKEITLVTLRAKMGAWWIFNPRVWNIRKRRNYYRALARQAAQSIRVSQPPSAVQ